MILAQNIPVFPSLWREQYQIVQYDILNIIHLPILIVDIEISLLEYLEEHILVVLTRCC